MQRLGRYVLLLVVVLGGSLLNGCGGHAVAGLSEGNYGGGDYGDMVVREAARRSEMGEPAAEVEPEGLPEAETPEVDPARTQRLVVYNGVLYVVVERISDSLSQIKSAVENMGGYMQEMTTNSITLKMPADKFAAAIEAVGKLGEVTQKDIKGADVTDQMRDLDIRLKNALQMRERLIKLVERADKVEDALKIEKELQRITETIELLKGKISHLRNSVAFSTLTVRLNSPIPQTDPAMQTPFEWVHRLGSGMTESVEGSAYWSRSSWGRSPFELPQGYVEYYGDSHQTRATSADGVMIHLHKEANYKGGEIGFWGSLVRRVLLEQKAFSMGGAVEVKVKGDVDGVILRGSKEIGSKDHGYLVGIATSKKYVYVFEAWGAKADFDEETAQIEQAVKSLRVR